MSRELVEAVNLLTERISRLEKAAKQPPRISWRPREVANLTGLSYGEVMEAIHDGRLAATKVGRLNVVTDAEVRRFIGENPAA